MDGIRDAEVEPSSNARCLIDDLRGNGRQFDCLVKEAVEVHQYISIVVAQGPNATLQTGEVARHSFGVQGGHADVERRRPRLHSLNDVDNRSAIQVETRQSRFQLSRSARKYSSTSDFVGGT